MLAALEFAEPAQHALGARIEQPDCHTLFRREQLEGAPIAVRGGVIGAGPAALCIAAALAQCGVAVSGLAPEDPAAPWPNTYGIWGPEVDALGLAHLLGHRWHDTRSYFGDRLATPAVAHGIDYGLFDKTALQQHWWQQCRSGGASWQLGSSLLSSL